MNSSGRLVVVSNRLPITISEDDGELHVLPSCGGLVSALLPAFKASGGCWVGWPGTAYDPEIARVLRSECAPEYSLEPVFFDRNEEQCFYHGCSNEILWPLFHDLQTRCNFDPDYWTMYREANEKFAETVQRVAGRDDFIWVHDYHLMLLAEALRERGNRATVAYFHHVPFPAPDIFEKLPWRGEILRALMRFSLVGFQTDRDRRNFIACARRFLPAAQLRRAGGRYLLRVRERCTTVGTFPISIDFKSFAADAAHPEVAACAEAVRTSMAGRKIILGVDRLDYTKGICERLAGYRALLEAEPALRGRVVLLQVVVPSRDCIPEYRELKECIERQVSAMNGAYGEPGWSPVNYLHRSVPRSELLALYRAADVALVTPLKDGMNLVSKEFCAARVDEQGVLVLSEFAGAAVELGCGALLVNPYDSEAMAELLGRALRMGAPEQRDRMCRMRQAVEAADVFRWSRSICGQRSSPSEPAPRAFPAARAFSMASRAV